MTNLRPQVVPKNRKVRQKRRLRSVLPGPGEVLAAIGRGLRRAAPALVAGAATAAVIAAVALGLRWLRTSARFALQRIEVTGHARVTEDEILARAGIAPGQNVFAVPVGEVERRLREHPWIADAQAERLLPDGIAISVVERHAAALVQVEGKLYLVDDAGRPFKRAAVERGEGTGLLVVSGVDRRVFASSPDTAAALARFALQVAGSWRSVPERPALGEVHLGREGVTLYTLEGATAIAVGRGEAAVFARFDDVWNALSPDERAAARTIFLNQRTRPGRAVVTLGNATR